MIRTQIRRYVEWWFDREKYINWLIEDGAKIIIMIIIIINDNNNNNNSNNNNKTKHIYS